MEENKNADLGLIQTIQGPKNTKRKKFCVKVYLTEQELTDWAKMAEEAGIRPRGLKPLIQKPNGFIWEKQANTKGLVKFIKNRIVPYWIYGEASRKENERRVLEEAKG